jgi:hypothetical protein
MILNIRNKIEAKPIFFNDVGSESPLIVTFHPQIKPLISIVIKIQINIYHSIKFSCFNA